MRREGASASCILHLCKLSVSSAIGPCDLRERRLLHWLDTEARTVFDSTAQLWSFVALVPSASALARASSSAECCHQLCLLCEVSLPQRQYGVKSGETLPQQASEHCSAIYRHAYPLTRQHPGGL